MQPAPPPRPLDRALEGLSSEQARAVWAPQRQVALLAAAGSGKTRVLTLRVARLVLDDESIDPRQVLVTTFSRRAATELSDRLFRLGVRDVRSGTFHRTALHLLTSYAVDRGLRPPVVASDRRRLMTQALDGVAGGRSLRPIGLETEIGWAKAHGFDPSHYEAAVAERRRRTPAAPGAIAEAYRRYEVLRKATGVLDLDDLLLEATARVRGDLRFNEVVRWRFRHLFVDEMQDVNPAQFDLLCAIAGPDPHLFVVGDTRQSIYGWNGADPALLTTLSATFANVVTMELVTNHRSTPAIVAVAGSIFASDAPQPAVAHHGRGELPSVTVAQDDLAEATQVAATISRLSAGGRSFDRFAVLARTNAQLAAVARALEARGIASVTAGASLRPGSDLDDELRARTWQEDHDDAPRMASVTLSSFHRSKGLEWPVVFVIGLSEGLVPYVAATTPVRLEEEQRLCYVAMTRATEQLHLSWAVREGDGTTGRARQPSRWLEPIEAARQALIDAESPAEPGVRSQILSELRARLDANRSTS